MENRPKRSPSAGYELCTAAEDEPPPIISAKGSAGANDAIGDAVAGVNEISKRSLS
jgi:hypothetical protein